MSTKKYFFSNENRKFHPNPRLLSVLNDIPLQVPNPK